VVTAISVTLVFATILSIFATSRIFLQLSVPVAFSLCYGALAFWLFGKGYVLDMAAPLVAVALSLVSTYGFLMFTEGREKRRIRAMFGQYVSPAILAELVDTRRDQLRAEVGARERLSILFSDLRGFTSLSENLAAEQVVELLNIHFSAMSEIVFRHQGTLDKFIGDAVMAFWGAPIRLPDHAQHAVRAALKMARAMKEVNETLATRGFPPIDTGLGVNTGEVVLGNIGSEHKLNYTVIGDHVNLSSRLEGLTKQYGCQIIISEYTYMELNGTIPCAVIDLVRVKGKQVPIRLFQPLAHPEDSASDIEHAVAVAELIERAFDCYLQRRFEEAESHYAQLPESLLREIFLARCRMYRETPPPSHWDGVYTLTTK
jgi:adenylate cyclase